MGMLGACWRGYGVECFVLDRPGNNAPLLSECTGLGKVVGVLPYLVLWLDRRLDLKFCSSLNSRKGGHEQPKMQRQKDEEREKGELLRVHII